MVAKTVVVVGGGQAGAQAIFSLRQGGFTGSITLFGEEATLPYQRPPLSKAYMLGDMAEERLYFKLRAWYEENGVDTRLSTKVTSIDRDTKAVHTDRGDRETYDALILSTGSRPRPLPLPGAKLAGVHDLRTLADVERLRAAMISGARLVIIGAGYIGLEAAAVARKMGVEVTVLEMAPRVLARVTSQTMSSFFEAEHRAHGVDVKVNARLESLLGRDGKVSAAVLVDGTEIPADVVLVGIGILPNQELAADAGLECENGIKVDEVGRTGDPSIYAIGDCANRPIEPYGHTGRLESVHNAIEQGKTVVSAILGQTAPKLDCPWFWSDQYDLKLQIAGLSQGFDDMIMRGQIEDRKFAVFYFRNERLIAVDAINSAPEFLASKTIIMSGRPVRSLPFDDQNVSMKDIAKRAQE